METVNDFSKGNIRSGILKIAAPMCIAQFVHVLYNVVDRLFVSRIPVTGMDALAGVGLTFPISILISAFANLCGRGGGPLFSISRGKKDLADAERIMGNALSMLLLFAAIITVCGVVWQDRILAFAGADDSTFVYAKEYLSVYILGTVFVMLSIGMNHFINAQGFGKTGMLAVVIGAAVNVALDPVFIYALGWGVKGAAAATVIAQGCSSAWIIVFLRSKKAIVRLRPSIMRIKPAVVKRIAALGLAGFTMDVTNGVVSLACNTMLQGIGGSMYVSVMTVISSVREIVELPVLGLSHGSQPVVGYNYGAGEYARVRAGIRFVTRCLMTVCAVCWVLLMLFPHVVAGIFNESPTFLETIVPCMRIYFAAFFFMSFQMVGQSVFVALNRTSQAIFFSVFRKGILVVPMILLLPRIPSLGVFGVFVAEPISQIIGGLCCYISMRATEKKLLHAGPQTAAPL